MEYGISSLSVRPQNQYDMRKLILVGQIFASNVVYNMRYTFKPTHIRGRLQQFDQAIFLYNANQRFHRAELPYTTGRDMPYA